MELTEEQKALVVEALAAVRASGTVNMMDRLSVADVAAQVGHDDAAELLRDRGMRREYVGLLQRMGRTWIWYPIAAGVSPGTGEVAGG